MKKVLYLTNIPSPYKIDFFNELGLRFDLTVVFEGVQDRGKEKRDKSWQKFDAVNFKFLFLDEENALPGENQADNQSENRKNSYDRLKLVLAESYFDLCIVSNYSTPFGRRAVMWLRHHKKPYGIHADGGFIRNETLLKRCVKRFFIKGADLYFSSGHTTTDYFVYYGADRTRIFEYPFSSIRKSEIRNDLDNSFYRKKLGLSLNEKIILSVGQIIHRKGFDVLLRAAAQLKTEAKLYIIGGEATEELSSLLRELGLNSVVFIPFVPFITILEWMAACDVFVLLTREDIWGLVINEALSMGAPVVSTETCVAAVELIENGVNGYVVENENEKAAAEKLDIILEDCNLREEMKKNNLSKAHGFTIESMTETYSQIIENYFFHKAKF